MMFRQFCSLIKQITPDDVLFSGNTIVRPYITAQVENLYSFAA